MIQDGFCQTAINEAKTIQRKYLDTLLRRTKAKLFRRSFIFHVVVTLALFAMAGQLVFDDGLFFWPVGGNGTEGWRVVFFIAMLYCVFVVAMILASLWAEGYYEQTAEGIAIRNVFESRFKEQHELLLDAERAGYFPTVSETESKN